MNTPTKVRNSEFNDKKRARTEDYDSYDSDEEFDDCFSATANQSSVRLPYPRQLLHTVMCEQNGMLQHAL
jgi:hypothetical protein